MSETHHDPTDVEVSELRDALPSSMPEHLTDDDLRSALDEARERLGPDAEKFEVHGAAWLLLHDPEQRHEQIRLMLEIADLRHRDLYKAERHLLGAFAAQPELDDTPRTGTRQEIHDELDRAEKLLAIAAERAGGTLSISNQEIADAPALLIQRREQGVLVTTYDLGKYLLSLPDSQESTAEPQPGSRLRPGLFAVSDTD